ncbi:MAG: ABC transporter ATP-binding protein [Saprospiraceae bacterium]|nr:ABC transporter ATP-binding protein [Saprospiraceae bacterium]
MKGLWNLLSRIRNYKKFFTLSIFSNIFLSIFTVISIPLLIPFFQLLFDRTLSEAARPEGNDLNEWVKYYLSDIIITHGKDNALLLVCALLLAVFFFKNLFRYLTMYFMAPVRNGIMFDLRKQMFNKFLSLPLGFYTQEKKGVLMSAMSSDVQEIEWSILSVIEAVFKSPIVMAGSIFFMLYIHAGLTLFVLLLIIFTTLIIGGISRSLKVKSGRAQQHIADLTSLLEETLGAMRIIKGFRAEEYQRIKFQKENAQYRDVLTRLLWRRDLSGPLSEFLGVAVVTVLLWYGSRLVFSDSLAPETFFAFVFAFYQVIEPAKSFSTAWYSIQKGLAALERVDKILDSENNIKSPLSPAELNQFQKNISFESVTHQYPGTDRAALDNINIRLEKGQIIALVGPSGAGKSTFVDLLPRFYDPSEGRITIDDKDIKSLELSALRAMFGIVSQDAILFNDTIANNISFGDSDYDIQAIENAARAANAHEFILELRDGYQTNIGDRGLKLSGGQRQRLTIARAILRNPPILILDEATSALDSESEKAVQDAFNTIMKSRTSIVIAHRLTTIQNADVILVMDEGRIIETGTHQELMNKNGAYANLVRLQTFESS